MCQDGIKGEVDARTVDLVDHLGNATFFFCLLQGQGIVRREDRPVDVGAPDPREEGEHILASLVDVELSL